MTPKLRENGLALDEADLRGAQLARAQWRSCTLRDAQLEGADFSDAVLRMCDLDQARATKAVFARARIENGSARGARFDEADLRGAVLTDTDFARASFRGANLEGASASGANLRGADLRGARLRDAVLTHADLRGADLTGADLHGIALHGADLRGALGVSAPPADDDDDDDGPPPSPPANPLADAMAPIVLEVLRTAGRSGGLDPDLARRTIASLEAGAPRTPALPPETLAAVSRVLAELGDGILPALIASMHQPGGELPPPAVMEMIRRLGDELGVPDAESAEQILARLAPTTPAGSGRGPN